jgi:hypothetical protein
LAELNGPNVTRTLSATLADLISQVDERVTAAALFDALGSRSFGSVLMVMALPAILLPPGASAALGAPLLMVSAQLFAGRSIPTLPNAFGRLSLSRDRSNQALAQAANLARKVERMLKPRLGGLLAPWHVRLVAAACALLSIVLILPAPIAHTAAGLGIVAFGAGLAHHDGVALLAGWASTLACGAILAAMVAALTFGLRLF